MKKKILIIGTALFFAASLIFSLYVTSRDSLFNLKNDLRNIVYNEQNISFVNWTGENGNYVSLEDPRLVLWATDCYVRNVTVDGYFKTAEDGIQVFWISSPEEEFSEEKSFYAPCVMSGGKIYFYVDREVYALRIDITPYAGEELIIRDIEINDRSIRLSINSTASCCILPTAAVGVLLFLILFHSSIVPYIGTFIRFIPLLKNLISRDLKVKYRRSVLGFLWSILNPLLMALVINAVFSRIFRFQVEYFAAYYLAGSLIFSFVAEATSGSMTSILGAAPLIKKVYIPKYIFPLQKCVFAFINMLFSCVAVLVVMVIQGVPFHAHMLLFWLPMLYAFVFAYGMSLILAAVTVYFRDIEHLYSVWLTIWMYLTPIIYPESLLMSNGLSVVMKLNPMYYFVHALRNVVMYGMLPTLSDNVMCISFALISLVCGTAVFKKFQDKFILYI